MLIPYVICGILRIVLWRFSFKITIISFLAYSDIMLNIRINFNFNMLLRIKKLDVRFWSGSKPISVIVEGFDIGKFYNKFFQF